MSNTSYPATVPASSAQAAVQSVVVGYVDANGNFQPATAASGLPVAGGGGGGGGGAVTVADGADVTQGAIADAAVAAGAAGTDSAKLRAISRDMGTVAANIPTVGQKASAASQPVVIANDQSALPVTLSGTNAFQILDTAGTNKATVKAASTAAAATDTSIVVQPLINGLVPSNATFASSFTIVGQGTFLGNLSVATEISGGAWTATSGAGASAQPSNGISNSFLVSVVFVAGASTGLDIILQESYDSGSTWTDIWHVERITASATYKISIPPLPTGRSAFRRFIWTNAGGAATTATVNISTNKISALTLPQCQFFDRTAAVLSGTPVGSATTAFNVAGCKIITATIVIATKAGTTDASYQIQTSADGTNWSNVGSTTVALVVGGNDISIVNNSKRFARVIVTSAAVGTAQVGTYVAITGSN